MGALAICHQRESFPREIDDCGGQSEVGSSAVASSLESDLGRMALANDVALTPDMPTIGECILSFRHRSRWWL